MAGVGFSGLATGLDTSLIIESLLARKQGRIDTISGRISDEEAKKRALNDVKSKLDIFDGILEGLSENVLQKRLVESGDESIISASAEGDSSPGEHEITINNLAKRSVVTVGQAQSSATEIIGAGDLNLELDDGSSLAVSLTDPNSTLTDFKSAINDQHGDQVQASIVEVSSGSFQLIISAKDTGASLNIKDDTDGASSSTLANFNGSFLDVSQTNSNGITRTQDGEDSEIVLDGITISRSSNEITDVLEGVTLNLQKEDPAASTILKIDADYEELINGFEEFANAYNDVIGDIERVTHPETGVLTGDTDLRSLKFEFQSKITRFVTNIDKINVRSDGSAGFTSLAQIGFKSDKTTGDLSIDKDTLQEALEDHFSEVQNLFMGNSTSSNPNVTVGANLGSPFSGTITLDTVAGTATIDGQSHTLNNQSGTLSFASGSPYEGLIFFTGGASDTNVVLELSAGIADTLEEHTDRFTKFSGVINDRTSGIDTRVRSMEKQLEQSQDRLESERTRLTAIFAKAEQAVSTLQGLQASLGAQSRIG